MLGLEDEEREVLIVVIASMEIDARFLICKERHGILFQPHAVFFKLATSLAGDLSDTYQKPLFKLPTSKWEEEEGTEEYWPRSRLVGNVQLIHI